MSVVTPSSAAKNYEISLNIKNLAKPKRLNGPIRSAEWPISGAAKGTVASERLLDLDEHKKPAAGYKPGRGIMLTISAGALNAVASKR